MEQKHRSGSLQKGASVRQMLGRLLEEPEDIREEQKQNVSGGEKGRVWKRLKMLGLSEGKIKQTSQFIKMMGEI